MRSLRIKGLVAAASHMRRELAAPLTAQRLQQVKDSAARTVREVDAILARHAVSLSRLPPPSQMAYRFLRNIDSHLVTLCESNAGQPPQAIFRMNGLRGFLDRTLHNLSHATKSPEFDAAYDAIHQMSMHLEQEIGHNQIRPDQLQEEIRSIRGFLAYFAEREHFEVYMAALAKAKPMFEQFAGRSARLKPPFCIQFRPMKAIDRVKVLPSTTQVQLPTPMICFTEAQFGAVAGLSLRLDRDKKPVIEAMLAEPYQAVMADIEALSGAVQGQAGVHHSLADSFDRVNTAYFAGLMARPKLSWSRAFTKRVFGHYDRLHDSVMVSCSLDRPDIPAYAVDFIVYHELLHKKHGVRWQNLRQTVHTHEFQVEERRFAEYEKAQEILKHLARGGFRRLPKGV